MLTDWQSERNENAEDPGDHDGDVDSLSMLQRFILGRLCGGD